MTHRNWALPFGATPLDNGTHFRVWAPTAQRVELVLMNTDEAHALERDELGYHAAVVPGARAGDRYMYRVDGTLYPDPAARALPDGVHGPAEIVDYRTFAWTDGGWSGLRSDDLVIYELHIGTFTPAGTFDAAIERLDALRELGVNAVEVMPIASFAGTRNWGYDGVALYAPAHVYGGPEGFRRFVDAAHARELGVILDVVYNHFGPDGNYLPAITGGRFFNPRHKTAWGDGINYDGEDSGPVRGFIVQNALYWAHEYHVDGLRLDATHAIQDDSPTHVLAEITDQMHALTPRRIVICEDERNDRRVLLPRSQHGYGADGVWADDLHHQLRRIVAGDSEGYFASYSGTVADLVATLRKGWFYEGQYSVHGDAHRGTPADGLPPSAFVHCIQNHDQVGNRATGDRLNQAVPLPVYRAVSTLIALTPYTPLIWMGQEWAASSPFCYFTDHGRELGELVTQGRREEFKHFSAFADPEQRERIPDPQALSTFERSKLRWDEVEREPHRGVRELYRAALSLRPRGPISRDAFAVHAVSGRAFALRLCVPGRTLLVLVNLGGSLTVTMDAREELRPPRSARWRLALSSEDTRFGGAGGVRLDDGTITFTGAAAVVLDAEDGS